MKKSEILVLIFSMLTALSALISLFLPFLHRSNFREAYLSKAYPLVEIGFYFEMSIVSIVFILTAFYLAFLQRSHYWALFLLLLNLININFIRSQIHYHCCLDHDFDTKTGLGFHVLFFSSLLAFLPVVILYLLHRSQRS
jgi:hypothetical protein